MAEHLLAVARSVHDLATASHATADILRRHVAKRVLDDIPPAALKPLPRRCTSMARTSAPKSGTPMTR